MPIEVEGTQEISRRLRSVADIIDDVENGEAGEAICQVMRITAIDKLNHHRAIDTGRLRDSVMTEAADFSEHHSSTKVSVGIHTDVPYAIFIEYGTGPRGDPEVPHTEKMSWVYPAKDGGFRVAHSQPAKPFMRPALYDNRVVFGEIIAARIREIWGR